jgi:hypothetical protein
VDVIVIDSIQRPSEEAFSQRRRCCSLADLNVAAESEPKSPHIRVGVITSQKPTSGTLTHLYLVLDAT